MHCANRAVAVALLGGCGSRCVVQNALFRIRSWFLLFFLMIYSKLWCFRSFLPLYEGAARSVLCKPRCFGGSCGGCGSKCTILVPLLWVFSTMFLFPPTILTTMFTMVLPEATGLDFAESSVRHWHYTAPVNIGWCLSCPVQFSWAHRQCSILADWANGMRIALFGVLVLMIMTTADPGSRNMYSCTKTSWMWEAH